jgi:AcrR family transcriptional regulator
MRISPSHSGSISRGRPREFAEDQALDGAVQVFCERGYHAASISDLTQAMHIAQGSIYKAYKDKRGVFLAAFDRYRAVRVGQLARALGTGGTGAQRLRKALEFYVDSSLGQAGRRGCLVVSSAVDLTALDPEQAQHVGGALAQNEALWAELIRQGQADKSIPATVDAQATARTLLCLAQGMRVVGKTGRSRAELQATVDVAMKMVG